MKANRIVLLVYVALLCVIQPLGCSNANKDASGGSPPLAPSLRETVDYATPQFISAMGIRINCNTGQISEFQLHERYPEWTAFTEDSENAYLYLHLYDIDGNYDFISENINGSPGLTATSTAVRFGLTLVNLTYEQGLSQYITCPRALFVPLDPSETGVTLPIRMSTSDGKLDVDVSQYGVIAPVGPYYYNRLMSTNDQGTQDWVIAPSDNQLDQYDFNLSTLLTCEVEIEHMPVVPIDYIDWIVLVEGNLGVTPFEPQNIWQDPYRIDNVQIERLVKKPGFYDALWDLDLIFPGDAFDIIADFHAFDISSLIPANYEVYTYFAGQSYGPWNPADFTASLQGNFVRGKFHMDTATFGLTNYMPSGMYDFTIGGRLAGATTDYIQQDFKIPFCNPYVDQAEDLYTAGYYIIGAVASTLGQTGAVNQLYLMNSFTRELFLCMEDDGGISNIKNISMQKAVGMNNVDLIGVGEGKQERIRIAYEFGNGSQMDVGLWEWFDDGSAHGHEGIFGIAVGEDEDFHGQNHKSMWDAGLRPACFVPDISPWGDVVAWSGFDPWIDPAEPPDDYGFDYKDHWTIYDGYASLYNPGLYSEHPENAPFAPYSHHMFDPDWLLVSPGSTDFVHRCGQVQDPPPQENWDYEYADNTWLMEPSVAGPTFFSWLPGDVGQPGHSGVYVVAFSRGSECGQESTPIIIYFFRVKDDEGMHSFEIINETEVTLADLTFAPSNYWSAPPNFENQPTHIGRHVGYEDHFLNPRVSADARCIIFEAYDGDISRVYKIDINQDGNSNNFISDSQLVGHSPMVGAQQFKPVVNTSWWDPKNNLFKSLDPVIAYQDGIDGNTDIWIAIETVPGLFSKVNVTGPIIDLNFHTFSGQPDIASRDVFDAQSGQSGLRSGLIFISHEYDNGDLFLIDHVYHENQNNHFTRVRRMTNLGNVMECQISDFVTASFVVGVPNIEG